MCSLWVKKRPALCPVPSARAAQRAKKPTVPNQKPATTKGDRQGVERRTYTETLMAGKEKDGF